MATFEKLTKSDNLKKMFETEIFQDFQDIEENYDFADQCALEYFQRSSKKGRKKYKKSKKKPIVILYSGTFYLAKPHTEMKLSKLITYFGENL